MRRLLVSALLAFAIAGLAPAKSKTAAKASVPTKPASKSNGAKTPGAATGTRASASLSGTLKGRAHVRGVRPGGFAGAADIAALFEPEFSNGCATFTSTYFHPWERPYLESVIHNNCDVPTVVWLTLSYYDAAGLADYMIASCLGYRTNVAYVRLAPGADWQFYYQEKRSARLRAILITAVSTAPAGDRP